MAKIQVVASVWGAELIKFLGASSYFAFVDLEEQDEFNLFFQINRDKTARAARN